ncbi:uncharacterized protein LOC115480982 [Microcaecilia unicolor]|uniref:Uncharacterized protein LOC115480982 n=1 Tax=Microcaecilia unicolor TaxID=1415580 RepID=A0A6P7Z8Z6_9AMPH|nr:uncharacterized protein LOC115480982 [Microcaecilia unicolor]
MSLLLLHLLGWAACSTQGAPTPLPSSSGLPGDRVGLESPRFQLISISSSCREKLLAGIRTGILQMLSMDKPPHIPSRYLKRVREIWLGAFHTTPKPQNMTEQNVSSDQLLIIRQQNCLEISYQALLSDLGWENWILYPESFSYTYCLGCQCASILPEACRLALPTPQPQEEVSCKPQRRNHLLFALIEEDGSLALRMVDMTTQCHGLP